MIKQAFIDLETTGTDYLKHGVYQIGGIVRYENVYEEFELSCDIFAEDEIDQRAFDITHIKPEDLKNFSDPFVAHEKLIDILDKHVDRFNKKDKMFFINFGAEFDEKFLRRWFESNGNPYYGSYFWHPPIEVQSLSMEYLKEKRNKMENFKLITVCRQLEIEVEEAMTHSALYDAKLAMQLYDAISKR